MIGLDRLFEREGVIAAGQFREDGTVARAVGDLSPETLERIARLCRAQQAQAEEAVKVLDETTEMDWSSLNGWMVWGGKYVLCVSGNTGVIADASKTDIDQLMVDLFGPPAAGRPIY